MRVISCGPVTDSLVPIIGTKRDQMCDRFEERAAILEFDGGLDRAEAEAAQSQSALALRHVGRPRATEQEGSKGLGLCRCNRSGRAHRLRRPPFAVGQPR